MNKIVSSILVLSSFVSAEALQDFKSEGYVRVGVQSHKVDGDKTYKQDSIGGKLSIYNDDFKGNGIGGKLSFYTTNRIKNHEVNGINFFDENSESYSILGEAYLFGRYKNTTLKIGRQELDTPFADTDDIGMMPNAFEAGVLANTDLPDTTLLLAGVKRWSGVDTDKPSRFQKLQNDNPVYMAAIIYDGIKDLSLNGYLYSLDARAGELEKITYADVTYATTLNSIGYEIALQYAKQDYKSAKSAKVSGVSVGVSFEDYGLGLTYAYNKSKDNQASNGFGGGPFFTSCEFLTVAEAGVDGEVNTYGFSYDFSKIGISNLGFEYHDAKLKAKDGKKADEKDFVLTYQVGDNLSFDLIYADIDDKINSEKYKNTRFFVNYSF